VWLGIMKAAEARPAANKGGAKHDGRRNGGRAHTPPFSFSRGFYASTGGRAYEPQVLISVIMEFLSKQTAVGYRLFATHLALPFRIMLPQAEKHDVKHLTTFA